MYVYLPALAIAVIVILKIIVMIIIKAGQGSKEREVNGRLETGRGQVIDQRHEHIYTCLRVYRTTTTLLS